MLPGQGKTGFIFNPLPEVGKTEAFKNVARFHGIPIIDARLESSAPYDPAVWAGLPKWEEPK